MKPFMNITKALADENRVRLLMALQGGEVCVCQLVEFLGLASSTVSKHLSILHQAELIHSRKIGRWIYYSLPGREASSTVRSALRWVAQSLEEEPRIRADVKRLQQVLAMDPVALCKRQCRR